MQKNMVQTKHSKMQGEITSQKMNKTVVVKVTLLKHHPKYQKQYTTFKRYKAQAADAEYQLGDIVEIEETRPLSKEKRWKVVRKIK